MRRVLPLSLSLAVLGAGASFINFISAQTASQTPTLMFRSSVDLVAVDVQVVGRDGLPIAGLGIDDFAVTVNGHARRVVSVDFIRKEPLAPPDAGGPDRPIRTPGYLAPGTRVFILAIDTSSFSVSGLKPALQSAQRFLSQLQPDDMVAVYEYPFAEPALALTHDHHAVGRLLDRVVGDGQAFYGNFDLTIDEMMDITARDGSVLAKVVARECTVDDSTCPQSIEGEASTAASYYESRAMQGIQGLSLLLRGLESIDGRKTVVLMSGGMLSADRVGSRPDLSGSMRLLGSEAASSNTNLYVMHLDNSFIDAFSATNRTTKDPGRRILELGRTSFALRTGLERLTEASGGALLHVDAGTADAAFGRVVRESAAYYLLGVQPVSTDRDGKLHFLRVKVKKRGVTVRSRTHVVIPAK